jgi:hypothetical protein
VRSRLAAAEVAGIQAAVADGVLLAEPCEEALETEAVAAVRRGAVPDTHVSMSCEAKCCGVVAVTYFLWSVYQ